MSEKYEVDAGDGDGWPTCPPRAAPTGESFDVARALSRPKQCFGQTITDTAADEPRLHCAPVIGTIGMGQPGTTPVLHDHLCGQRQRLELLDPRCVLVLGDAGEPIAAVGLPQGQRLAMSGQPIQQHLLVIATNGMKPGVSDEFERARARRTAIDEIAHTEKTIPVTIESNPLEQRIEHMKTTVNIADDIIPA